MLLKWAIKIDSIHAIRAHARFHLFHFCCVFFSYFFPFLLIFISICRSKKNYLFLLNVSEAQGSRSTHLSILNIACRSDAVYIWSMPISCVMEPGRSTLHVKWIYGSGMKTIQQENANPMHQKFTNYYWKWWHLQWYP